MPYKDPDARRAYHVINSERARERVRKWREANPEKARIQTAKRAQRHPDRASKQGREWRQVNAERVRAYEKARVRPPGQERDYQQRRGAGKRRRNADTRAYAEVLLSDPCSYCGNQATGVDHVVPLYAHGPDLWENLTSCCARCNSSKNATALLIWMARRSL